MTTRPKASERLREQLRETLQIRRCECCGQTLPDSAVSLRAASAGSGVPIASLSRFLNGGAVNSDTFDLIDAWLNPYTEDNDAQLVP